MKLLKASLLSFLAMWGAVILFFWVAGIGNDLRLAATLGAAVVAPVVIATVLLLWGLPIHVLLSKQGRVQIGWYVFAGFFPGPLFVALLRPFGEDAVQDLLMQSVFCGFIGVLGAVLFWSSAVRRNA